MPEIKSQQMEELEDVVEEESVDEVENYLEIDKQDIVPTAKELRQKEKEQRKADPKPPTEKQLIARKNNRERLLTIHKQKEAEREQARLDAEKKIIDDLKIKWLKEYERTKLREAKADASTKVKLPPTQRLRAVKPKAPVDDSDDEPQQPFLKRVASRKRAKKASNYDDDSDDTGAESTDTETIRKKIEKVKKIEAVIQPRVANPYIRMLERFYN
jgi:hypothetical protein